jgi:hypothetical protein
VDFTALGVKLGKATVKGATTAPKSERLIVSASNTVTIKETPLTGTLKVYVIADNGRDIVNELTAGTPGTTATAYSIATKVITVNSSIAQGTYIKVLYDYTTGANAQKVRVTAKDFPGYCRVSGTGYVLDESGNKAPVSFIVYKCKPTPEFEMTFATGKATEIPFNCSMFPDLVDGEEVFFDLIPLADEADE